MTTRELLEEQYEDALFALLMDDFSVEQGKTALEENERLKADPDAAVPLPVQQRCLKLISKQYSKRQFRAAGRAFYKVVNKVAIVALAAMLLFTTAFAASPSFRLSTLNLVIDTFNDRTNLQLLTDTAESQSSTGYEITANWLPAGYELISETHDDRGAYNLYKAQTGEIMQINIAFKEGMIVSIDTEDAFVESIEVQGMPGLLSLKDNNYQIAWTDESEGLLWTIYGENIAKDDIIRIAENVGVK